MILDGWGIADNKEASAIDKAQTPFADSLYTKYPTAKLQASGLAVGLPDGQMGNSEVGHMNIGAGRIVYQDLVRINKEVESGSIQLNIVLKQAIDWAKTENKNIHLIGLVSDGGVHSHVDHLKGLVSVLAEENCRNVFVHAFTDGRDADPKSGLGFMQDLQNHLASTTGKIASVCGRYYAMDRDKRWERVKLAYDLLANGIGEPTGDALEAIAKSYDENVTDEFIKPIVIKNNGTPLATIKENDVVICFNFRTDRGREITQVLTQEDFPEQEMKKMPLHYVTLTNYDESFRNVEVMYEKDNLKNTLGEILESQGKHQIRIAETEKYPHVTFFFSGGREEPFKLEKRILCPSPKVATYDLQPEMSAKDIRDKMILELEKGEVDFACLNFANPDMVGHTGVFEAAVTACETVDQCAEAVLGSALENGYTTIVIADHGNSDMMINPDGSPNTAHTTSLVPFILVDKTYDKPVKDGKLGDLAPTILTLMGIAVPPEMTGNCLLS